MKKIIKYFIPPIFIKIYQNFFNTIKFKGEYESWKEAKKNSNGYDTEEILDKVRNSAIKVKNGEAIYERDGVIYNKIQYSWPLLAGLMYASLINKGSMRVLDFGGSLGTTYFQNKKFFNKLKNFSWSIVEQKKFVKVGKNFFEDDILKFFYDINICIKEKNPNILILSSVLQYIENPYRLLDKILVNDFDFILIDRTTFATTKKKIKIQTVSSKIYEANYPIWFLDESEMINFFKKYNYHMIEDFDALGGISNQYYYKGFILNKIK